jgi:hypothetical protein
VQNDGGGGSCGDVGDDDDDLCIIFARNILLQTSESLQISYGPNILVKGREVHVVS